MIAATAPLWLAGCAGVTLGTFLGVPLLSRLPASLYRRLVGALLVALGLSLLAAGL